MLQVFRIFFSNKSTNSYLVLTGLLLSSLAEGIGLTTLLPTFTILAGGSQTSSPIGVKLIDAVRTLGFEPSLGVLISVVLTLLVIKAVLTFLALSYAGIAGTNVAISLRRRLIGSVFAARWSFYSDQRSGKFANVIANEAGKAGDAFWFAANAVSRMVQTVGYVVVALVIDWRLALLGIASSLIIAGSAGQLISVTKRAGYKQSDRTALLTIYLIDLLANIKPLRAMHRHENMLQSIGQVLKKLKRALIARELSKVGLTQGSEIITATLAAGGFYFAHVYLRVPLPELMVSTLIFFQITAVVWALQKNLQTVATVEGAYVRTQELIAIAENAREADGGVSSPLVGEGCRFVGVSFAHDRDEILSNVTFDIPAGAITVFVGQSGSGKTTIADLLVGLRNPVKGKVFVGNTPLDQIDKTAWRRMIGYVPQDLALFHTTIRENIALGDKAIGDSDILAALTKAGAAKFVDDLANGLDTDVGEMGSKLSGGQRQRISIARALVTKPKVLILDEVTSALDPRTEDEIVSNIAQLRGEYTIVAITHSAAWRRIADRLYSVSNGRVRAIGLRRHKAARSGGTQPVRAKNGRR